MRVKIFFLLVSLLCVGRAVLARKFRIPTPKVNTEESLKISPSMTLEINGEGFIENFPEVHKVQISNTERLKLPKIKLKVLEAKKSGLKLQIPQNINYGDYDLSLKLKTKNLKSKALLIPSFIELRPEAASKPILSEKFINNALDIKDLFDTSNKKNLLVFAEELTLGKNLVRAYYIDEESGYKSLFSEASEFYYLPINSFEPVLELASESPLKTYALVKNNDKKIDISEITSTEKSELKSSYFIKTPWDPRFLEHSIELSPVYISELKVSGDEYVILTNRSPENFPLDTCYLSDSITIRYEFNFEDYIVGKSIMKVEENLGLNDSSPDSMSLFCELENSSELSLIDIFKYENLDENGFAIKQAS
jgi:hypothetical protein